MFNLPSSWRLLLGQLVESLLEIVPLANETDHGDHDDQHEDGLLGRVAVDSSGVFANVGVHAILIMGDYWDILTLQERNIWLVLLLI